MKENINRFGWSWTDIVMDDTIIPEIRELYELCQVINTLESLKVAVHLISALKELGYE